MKRTGAAVFIVNPFRTKSRQQSSIQIRKVVLMPTGNFVAITLGTNLPTFSIYHHHHYQHYFMRIV
jgi:hypothetical protein